MKTSVTPFPPRRSHAPHVRMAAERVGSTSNVDVKGSAVPTPLALSNREEDELRKQVRAEALKKCDPVVKEFADCATGRTVSVVWACREQHKEVKRCMREVMGEDAMKERKRLFLQEKRSRQTSEAGKQV